MKEGSISIEEKLVGHFRENGNVFEIDDVKEMRAEPPEAPPFPFFILSLAMAKDLLDAFQITGIAYIIAVIISVLIAAIIFIWMLNKGGGARWKGKLLQTALRRFGVVFFIELIPGVGIIPAWTLLIILTYYREKKIVRLFWEGLELIKGDLDILEEKKALSPGGRTPFQKNRRRAQRSPAYKREMVRRRRSMDRMSGNKINTDIISGDRRSYLGNVGDSRFNGVTRVPA